MPDFLCWFHPAQPLPAGAASPAPRDMDHVGDGRCGIAGGGTFLEGGMLAAVAGHPRWLDAETARVAEARGHSAAAIRAWREHGEGYLEHVGGDFGMVVADPERGRLTAAIDRLGQTALFFARCRGGVILATRRALLSGHPDSPREIDPQSVHDFFYFHMIPAPATLYAGLEKLPAAHRIGVDGSDVSRERYWTPAFSEEAIDGDAFGERLRETLSGAVERRLGPGTGSFLSGGLDSSTVTGLHARLRPEEARAFSIGFDVPGYDEIPYARRAAEHFGVPLKEYYVTEGDVADAVETVVRAFDEPFGNSSALPAYFCARRAREEGIERMLAGDGGDELFGGNARYAKQGVFEQYFRLPAALRRGLVEPLLCGPLGALPGLRKGRSYVRQARIPLPDRLETYNFLHRIDPASVFEAEFLESIDHTRPLQRLREVYAAPDDASTLNRMLYLDWQITLADNDLRKVDGACRLAGVDVAYPMLDDEVVALSCRIPSGDKLRAGRLRHFYKQAFRGFLPDEILTKKKHGFGLPFGMWLRDDPRLHELARDMLHKVQAQGWIRPAFIDELMEVHLRDHPGYYGEFIWVLMALGIWLDHHGL
ncbi:MAG: asparagine synthase-related protein [Halofilum sp. (in: g-proteobacteria)]|nr:asparagine synthase-related protein [Halofilum sp. (in: g-proteobacteria)]